MANSNNHCKTWTEKYRAAMRSWHCGKSSEDVELLKERLTSSDELIRKTRDRIKRLIKNLCE